MNFGRHGTFYLRNGWISKAMSIFDEEESTNIFSPKNMRQAIDKLGIGRAMVVSLRYWLDVLNITEEKRVSNEIVKELTPFGELLKKHDRYIERKGSLWLLHYYLVTSKEEATTWYWFFNKFNQNEFNDEIFMEQLVEYVNNINNKEIAENTLRRDYLCLKNTYLFEGKRGGTWNMEEVISSPLRELKLITYLSSRQRYLKNRGNINDIAPEIFYYTILDQLPTDVKQVSLEDLLYKPKAPGKVFNLDINDIYNMVNVLEGKGYVKFNRVYSGDYLEIIERSSDDMLKDYYSNYKID